MSGAAASRRRQGPGRLDPTVRGLLRAFLSPAVADRYASALQPIAVADRDAALAGAVSTLRSRFFVLPEEIAVVLVEDAGWSVADVSTMLGLSIPSVRAALRTEVTEHPRVGATAPPDADGLDDEAAAVEAMLADLPVHRRAAADALAGSTDGDPVDVELSTVLPAYLGRAELAARAARADRLQRLVVNGTVVGVLAVVALVVGTTSRPLPDVPEPDAVAVQPSPTPAPSPTTADATPTPESEAPGVPVGDPELLDARFVASVDPATGDPGPTLAPATTSDDPRLWLRFGQLPADDPVILLTFTAPSGRSTVRPVLLSDRTPLAAVRLPDELGRAPGRYAVRIEAPGLAPVTRDLELVEAPAATSAEG